VTCGLRPSQTKELVDSIPYPNSDPALRSKFYDSPTLVYLLSRGFGSQLPNREAIVQLVELQLRELTEWSSPSTVSIVLWIATLLELKAPMPSDLYRKVAGRLVAAELREFDGIAARWFLEKYSSVLDTNATTEVTTRLEDIAALEVSDLSSLNVEVEPTIAAMALETSLSHKARYELLPVGYAAAQAAIGMGKLRYASAAAFAFLVGLLTAATTFGAVRYLAVPSVAALWSGGLVGLAIATLVTLTALGYRRSIEGLGAAILISVGYYATLIVLALRRSEKALESLASNEIIVGVAIAVIGFLWVALQAAYPDRGWRKRTKSRTGDAAPDGR
jgi:hypothetical protein